MRWVVVHKPIAIEGRTFTPGQEGDSFIPVELESKLTEHDKKACAMVPDSFVPKTDARVGG